MIQDKDVVHFELIAGNFLFHVSGYDSFIWYIVLEYTCFAILFGI